MKIARIFAPFVVALVACSSSTPSTSEGPGQDRGLEGTGDTEAATAPDKNPEGVPYPTKNLGTNPRGGPTADAKPGNTMVNYKFLGYPDGDMSQGLKPISMATFFDPSGSKYKLIHVQASGTWCVYCQEETKVVVPLRAKLADRKVVWLISLAEGPTPGTAATAKDLDRWVAQFKAPFTHFLDPANKNFGVFYDAAALPWNANIDARTMEILSSAVGAATSETAVLADVDKWLAPINSGVIKPL